MMCISIALRHWYSPVNTTVTVVNITFSASCSAIILDITSNTTAVTSTSGGIVLNSGSHILRLSGGTLTVTDVVYVDGGTLQLNSGIMNVNCFTTTGTFGLSMTGGILNCAGATLNIDNGSNEVLDFEFNRPVFGLSQKESRVI